MIFTFMLSNKIKYQIIKADRTEFKFCLAASLRKKCNYLFISSTSL